jgi:protein translocase SecG subunit
LLAIVYALLAAPAASAPTPIPVGTIPPAPINGVTFHPTLTGQYPWILDAIQILFLIATVALIALMSAQTTKTEGLSGSIGGRAESAYHGRLGLDQQITRITTITAYSWIILAVVFFVVARTQ